MKRDRQIETERESWGERKKESARERRFLAN